MSGQTSYSFYQSAPFAGVLADLESNQDVRSYINEEVTAGLPFGIAVCQGVADDGCLLMADINSKIVGVTVHTHAVEPFYLPTSPSTAGIGLKGTAGVLRRGRIWAVVDATVAPGGIVCARYTATTAPKDQLGRLGPSTDSSSALQITGALWSTTAAAAGLAIADINMP